MIKSIYTFNAGPRAKECAQAIAVLIFNAEEDGKDVISSGVRYNDSDVSIVIDPEEDTTEGKKALLDALIEVSSFVLNAAKNGFDGSSAEEMLEIFSYPDEGTGFYSNVKGKTDLQFSDLENVVDEIKKARSQIQLGEAVEVIKKAGLSIKK